MSTSLSMTKASSDVGFPYMSTGPEGVGFGEAVGDGVGVSDGFD